MTSKKRKSKDSFTLERKEYRKRYLLYGSEGPWLDYFIEDDNREKLLLEGYFRLKYGGTAHLLDQETGKDVELKLKKGAKK